MPLSGKINKGNVILALPLSMLRSLLISTKKRFPENWCPIVAVIEIPFQHIPQHLDTQKNEEFLGACKKHRLLVHSETFSNSNLSNKNPLNLNR